jgi:hypothetical protein
MKLMPNGTFVLADIGGYTTFLTDVGIEHAKEITSHLFNRCVSPNLLDSEASADRTPPQLFSTTLSLFASS